jgi:predicted nucleic acid-binding protein
MILPDVNLLVYAYNAAAPRHERAIEEVGTAGNLTTDAHLAALAIEHQAELHSNDADFARFAGLRWKNPLK